MDLTRCDDTPKARDCLRWPEDFWEGSVFTSPPGEACRSPELPNRLAESLARCAGRTPCPQDGGMCLDCDGRADVTSWGPYPGTPCDDPDLPESSDPFERYDLVSDCDGAGDPRSLPNLTGDRRPHPDNEPEDNIGTVPDDGLCVDCP